MKQQEFSYYELYLLSYLKENHPELVPDTDFIKERANKAADRFEQARLEGQTIEGAQESAMKTLLQGLHFSKYNTIIEVLWNEFEEEIAPADAIQLALKLQPFLADIFSAYPLSDGFAYTSDYEMLYTELTGTIQLYFEDYGI